MGRSFKLLGHSIYLPGQAVSSLLLDQKYGFADGTVEARTGVQQRYYARHETASEMAKHAIMTALQHAGLALTDIDCLIAASGTMEQAIPCNAAKILAQFTPSLTFPAFDINMTCLSGLMAMDLAANMLQGGQYKRILIVSSEVASAGLDWQNPAIGGLFGDGAAALVVSVDDSDAGVNASLFRTYSQGVAHCEIRGGGSLNHPAKIPGDYTPYGMFRMNGKELYRLTAKVIAPFCAELLEKARVTLDTIAWVVPHQASGLALQHLVRQLGLCPTKVINMLQQRGNQIAVSLPAALHELLTTKPVKPGDKVLLIGTSAGLSLGAMVMTL
ncbi:3-oxoacyl-[acyl-carrier-protein] synthase III C-terminal domain-containing protein [Rheinheimera sp.]|uniref:3-oxoacyl-[acyl-carrier-protein] synthase III C-terminal domain-containing protein n=1 Tax=Rheinheimera sp. TaxID=1869214 RepID=UPI0040470892